MTAASWCIVMTFPTHIKKHFLFPPFWFSYMETRVYFYPLFTLASLRHPDGNERREATAFLFIIFCCCTKCASSTASTSPGRRWNASRENVEGDEEDKKKKEPKDSTSSAPLGTSQEPQLRATTTRRATKSIFRCKTRWAPTNLIRLCSQPNKSPKVRPSDGPFHYKKNTETKRQHNYKKEE
jgi:hypothetical protein